MGSFFFTLLNWAMKAYGLHRIAAGVQQASKEESDKMNAAVKELQNFDSVLKKLIFQLDNKKSKEEKRFLLNEIEEAKKKMEELDTTQRTAIKRTPIIRNDEIIGYHDELVQVNLTQAEILENEKERVKLQKIIYGNQLRLKQLDEEELEKSQEKQEITKKEDQRTASQPIDVSGRMPTPKPIGTTPQSLFGEVDLGKPKLSKVPTTPPEQSTKQAKETFTELIDLSESFQQSFLSGISAVQTSIDQGIGGAFKSIFGEANSLLEIFIANFVSSMASNVLSLLTGGAAGGILSILGFAQGGIISEPIFGIGKSGQRYLFGEAGREAVIPFSEMAASAQATRMGMLQNKAPQFKLTTKISGQDLYVMLEKAKSSRASREL